MYGVFVNGFLDQLSPTKQDSLWGQTRAHHWPLRKEVTFRVTLANHYSFYATI